MNVRSHVFVERNVLLLVLCSLLKLCLTALHRVWGLGGLRCGISTATTICLFSLPERVHIFVGFTRKSAGSVAVRDLLLTFLLLTFHGDSYVLRYSVPVSLGQRGTANRFVYELRQLRCLDSSVTGDEPTVLILVRGAASLC